MQSKKYVSIDDYIKDFEPSTQIILQKIRNTIQKTAPAASETISYNMPAFKLKKVLVFFAAYKNHIGFYALPSGNEAFQEQIKKYKTGKGSIQFPINEPIPFELIEDIVRFRLKETEN